MDARAIGVFDSGVGGLTVVRSLIDLLPTEAVVYYGDTARGPYGPRERADVRRCVDDVAQVLVREGVKLLVAACNSASAAGLDHVRDAYPDLAVIEVIEPSVRAAVKATRNRHIGVIGTALTITSRSYDRAVAMTRENVELFSRACPRFVEFVERGETTGPEIIELAEEYLQPLKEAEVDTLILGCTHYPLLRGVIQYVMGRGVVLIESDKEVAIDVFAELTRRDMFRPRDLPVEHRFLASGDVSSFTELGHRFLGPEITKVEEHPWS
ncbi:MAG TPA: glutamate racemase [Actinomycetota bacterium]